MSRSKRQFAKNKRDSILALASAVTMTFAATANAAGQDGSSDGLEEIVVSGYRASLDVALDTKKKANGVVDQIVAEDIAKFPDQNLAESLQRVPGVSINQDAGEGRQITVRGLGPSYSRTRINGMEAIATLGTTDQDGGVNRGRSFDFNVFGSEIFQSLTVHKTSGADLDEGSLGATVDLNTAHPLDFKNRTFVASAQVGYNDLAHTTSPRIAALFTSKFLDDKLGVLISAAYSKRKVIEVGASTVRWQSKNAFFNSDGSGYTTAELSTAFVPRIPRYDYYHDDQARTGITGSLQFKPSNATELDLDLLYSKYDAGRDETFLETPAFSSTSKTAGTGTFGGVNNMVVTAASVDDHNSLIYGVFDNVGIRTEFRHDDMTTDFKQATLNLKQTLGENVSLHAMFGYADSKFDNPVQTTLIWDSVAPTNGYSYNFSGTGIPYINAGSLDVTNPANWKLTQIRLRPQGVDNKFDNATVDLNWKLSDALSWTNGVQYKKFDFSTFELRRSNGTTGNQESNIPASVASIATSQYAQLISIPGLDAPTGATIAWAGPNLSTAAGLMNLYDPSVFPMGFEPALGNNYSVQEKDTGVYTQLNFSFPVASMTLRGDVGVRYVQTKQSSSGYTFTSGSPLANSVENTYSDVLPALNSVLEVTDDFLIRLSAAKVMARPGLGSLNPGASVSVSGASFSVTAGNPYLKPNRATSVDLGFEWYPAKGMLLGTTLFYKKIDTFVSTVRTTGPFSANPLGLPDSVAVAACGSNTTTCFPDSPNWQFNLPANTPGGPLKGIEVNLQVPFAFLPSGWNNLGMLLNYTYIDSDIDYVDNTGTVVATGPLTELSKNAANGTLYFDNHKFSARVSAAYRSNYLQTIPGRNGNDVEGTKGSTTIDFSTSWTFNDHLTATLEGQNLTDVPNSQYVDSQAERLGYYHLFGRQFMLGLRAKFD
ncbi:MAG TPA: TonB-dependent receptor [Steroidobacteraceae bacterium]|nr:TonB-dependent receptor [Steroidobacteraceae bacterium]